MPRVFVILIPLWIGWIVGIGYLPLSWHMPLIYLLAAASIVIAILVARSQGAHEEKSRNQVKDEERIPMQHYHDD